MFSTLIPTPEITPRIDPDFKARWVEALRSGRYLQGKGGLREPWGNADRFCCLGVACELLPEPIRGAGAGDRGFPLTSQRDAMGFSEDRSYVILDVVARDGGRYALSELNDCGQFTFAMIADIIEYFL